MDSEGKMSYFGKVLLEVWRRLYNSQSNVNSSAICVPSVNHYTLYQGMLIPAVIILIIFSCFEKRKSFLPNMLCGRPGCIFPMDALTRDTKIPYACAFGVTVVLLKQMIFERKYAFEYDGDQTTLVIIISVIIYGLAYYPIFACITLDSVYSYGLGSLYVWVFTIIELVKLAECDRTFIQRLVIFGRSLPCLACWVYLALSLPFRCILACCKKCCNVSKELSLKEIRDSYQGHAVKRLLRRPPSPPAPTNLFGKLIANLLVLVNTLLYHWKKEFRYSSRLVSVMVTSAMMLYIVAFELIFSIYVLSYLLLGTLKQLEIEALGFPTAGESQEVVAKRGVFLLLSYIVTVPQNCFFVSSSMAFLVGLLSVLHMLSAYRRNLNSLYRGDNSHIPPLKERSNANHMLGFLTYAGYQVGYIGWAFVLHFAILSLLTSGLAGAIFVLVNFSTEWFIELARKYWSVPVTAFALKIIQFVIAKFIVMQGRGQYMAIDNRRVLFIFVYFMFFFNVFLGVLSCLLRIVRSMVYGIIFIGRLDHSALSRRFEFSDTGFASYVGFLHVESAHTHPCVVVFVRLMLLNLKKRPGPHKARRGDIELAENSQTARWRMKARFNWHVVYSLLNNPSLRMYRKGYIQTRNNALKRGEEET